jgi:hypothetical protein
VFCKKNKKSFVSFGVPPFDVSPGCENLPKENTDMYFV